MFKDCFKAIINGEEVLFITIDERFEHTREFAKGKNKEHLRKRIKEYIQKNNISFQGFKVFMIVSGVVIASLNFSPNELLTNNIEYTTAIITHDTRLFNEYDSAPEFNDYIEIEAINEEETYIIDNAPITSANNPVKNNQTTDNVTKNNSNSPANNNLITNNETITNQIPNEPVAPTEVMVSVYRSNGIILNLTLNDYLIGVVGAEMPASFHLEALKAGVLVARTYAMKALSEGRKLTDTITTQVYKDNNQLKNIWGADYDLYYSKIKNAVEDVDGEVIMYNNTLIDAVYHSTSNGKTADSIDVWGNNIPYLKSVDSPWCKNATSYLRSETKDFDIISLLLGININDSTNIEVLSRTSNNSVKEISIDGKILTGIEIRTILGIRSTDFDLELTNNAVNIITRGYGHGVGMSQYGASGMAKEGKTYKQIIKHYYTGVTISKL